MRMSPIIISVLISSVFSNRDHLGHKFETFQGRTDGDISDVILEQSYYIDTYQDYYDHHVDYNEIPGSSDTKENLEINPVVNHNNSSFEEEEEESIFYFDSDLEDGNFTGIQLEDYPDYNETTLDESPDFALNETDDTEIVVPLDQIISIAPVAFEESPLNLTFEAVPGELSLEDNTTVSVGEEDITQAVIQKVKDILTVVDSNDTVQSVIDDLIKENVTIRVTTTEKPKSAVEIYLELLQSMIKPSHEEQVLPDISPVVDIGVFADNNNEGNIDYTDEYYDEFLSNQAVLNNFSEDDLLIGDSFETEGNINLMLETDEEQIVDEPTPTTERTREMFNSAFPELYRDLEIFDKISRGSNKGSLTRNLRKRIVEKRVKKRVEKPKQSDEEKDVVVEITTEQVSTSTETVRPHILLTDLRLPRFVDAEAELDKDLLVMTSSGSLYGRRTASSKGLEVKEYFSVPYAQPPVGRLRFKSPQPSRPWTQILNNSVESSRCWSSHSTNSWNVEDTGMAEDCLYLSIWTPASPAEKLRAVMVLLTSGKEEGDLSGLEMAATGDVVFVKAESRHGALGFLASEESLVTTNIGLLDQTLALKWIQGNIDLFGGDSTRVTILGSGSGGNVASLHLLSASSCPLFNNMILQSGNPFSTTVSLQEATKRAGELAELVGCGGSLSDTLEMVDCLRQVDPQVLINQEHSVSNYSLNMEPFPPIVDGQFLIEDPVVMMEHNVFKKCPVMIGTNSNEGLAEMFEYLPELSIQSNLFSLTSDQLDSAMARMFKTFSPALISLVKFQYGMFDASEGNATKVRRFFGLQSALADKEVVCNVDKLAKTFANDNNKVYRYFFNPIGDDIFASELSYVLGEPLQGLGRSLGGSESAMSRKMIKLWSNFAKTDSPGLESSQDRWPVFESPDWEYLKLEDEDFNIGQDMRSRVCQFWERVVPNFLPPVPDRLSRRSGGQEELSCRGVKQAKIYFPGYRSVIRL